MGEKETVSRLLQKGRARIAAGWTQGMATRRVGDKIHYCAVGALPAKREIVAVRKAAYECLLKALPPGYANITTYNDEWGRRKEEILALYDRALTEVTK